MTTSEARFGVRYHPQSVYAHTRYGLLSILYHEIHVVPKGPVRDRVCSACACHQYGKEKMARFHMQTSLDTVSSSPHQSTVGDMI